MNGHLKKYGRWGELVEESEILTMKAESLQHSDTKSSRKLHGQAAVLYEEALRLIPPKKFILHSRSEEHTSELQSLAYLLFPPLLFKKKNT